MEKKAPAPEEKQFVMRGLGEKRPGTINFFGVLGGGRE